MAHTRDELLSHKISTIVSWLLAAYASIRYFVGINPFDKHNPYHVRDTPFSSNIIVLIVYWGLLFLLQILFVTQIFVPTVDNATGITNRLEVTKKIAWHFSAFNLGVFVWTLLFVKHHYFWSEVILVLNFVNVLSLYFEHKTYAIRPLSNWALIHLPTAAFPLSWLFYAIFWNGAVLFHVHKFLGRVLANVLIWLFLLVPGFFLVAFNDYGVGISSSILTFGLGLGQLFTKTFALQWIFAFVISGLLLLLSLVGAITGSVTKREVTSETAPLIET